MRRTWVLSALLLAAAAAVATCSGDEPTDLTPGDSDGSGDGSGDSGTDLPPAPFNSLSFPATNFEVVDVDDPGEPAGTQGFLRQASDGTLYYAYFKFASGASSQCCNIAAFGGDEAPCTTYELKVGVKAPQGSWSVETVPLQTLNASVPFITTAYGMDGLIDSQDRLVISFAGGQAGLFSCGSGDLVVATRTAANTYSFQTPVQDSSSCCSPAECNSSPCTSGSDVGPWSSVALDDNDNLAVSFMDYHNNADMDGQAFRGLELWEQSGGVTGIQPWSGKGQYGDLLWLSAHSGSTYTGPLVAYTTVSGANVFTARREGSSGVSTDWVESNTLRPGFGIGPSISMKQATDGRVGLVFHVSRDTGNTLVNDLFYCESLDNGSTWQVPCEPIDETFLHLGQNPSLAFDNNGNPAVSYYLCGSSSSCTAEADGLRFAWRDDTGRWWPFDVDVQSNTRSGFFSSLVFDPTTNEPIIAYQNLTSGAAMAVRGSFGGS